MILSIIALKTKSKDALTGMWISLFHGAKRVRIKIGMEKNIKTRREILTAKFQ